MKAKKIRSAIEKNKRAFFIVIAVSLLTSCASSRAPENSKLIFQTRITSNGLKHFQLRMIRPRQQIIQLGHGVQQNPNSMALRTEKRARAVERILTNELALKIEGNHYCREGYWLLSHNYYGDNNWVRGECNETATKKDRSAFPDTIKQW